MNDHAPMPAPPMRRTLPRVRLRRHRTFRPEGASWRLGHYLKLVYGILGLGFLIFTAATATVGEGEPAARNLQPSAWYWQWLAGAPSAPEEIGIPEPIDDPFLKESDETDAATQTAASWGTDGKRRSVRLWMGRGAILYLAFGLISGFLGVLGGICWAVVTEWPTRPTIPLPHQTTRLRNWIGSFGRSALEMIDTVPKFLLLIAICALGGKLTMIKFSLAMAVFLMFGTAMLFRDRIASFFAGEQYLYALEIGLSRARIFFVHLIGRQLGPLILVQLPFMVSAFLLWEATLSYFNWGPGSSTWGALLRDNFQRAECYWAFWIPLLSLLLVISSLYVLGDALRERVEDDES